MSALRWLYRGETQEWVCYKQGFTISEFVLSEECLVTPKNMFGAETPHLFTINETHYERGCSKKTLIVLMQKESCYLVEWG